jgi:hypothetical protein
MKKNMGSVDKVIRLLVVVAFAILYVTNTITGTLGMVLLAIALLFLVTSLISYCPLYTLLGITTCPKKKK